MLGYLIVLWCCINCFNVKWGTVGQLWMRSVRIWEKLDEAYLKASSKTSPGYRKTTKNFRIDSSLEECKSDVLPLCQPPTSPQPCRDYNMAYKIIHHCHEHCWTTLLQPFLWILRWSLSHSSSFRSSQISSSLQSVMECQLWKMISF